MSFSLPSVFRGSHHLSGWPAGAWRLAPCLREPSADDPEYGHSPASPAESGLADAPDFDGIWKKVLQRWLPECLALFWPDTHALIDWSRPPTFLHQELQRLHRIMKRGARRTDLLVELRLRAGGKFWLLLHLEVETGPVSSAFNWVFRLMVTGHSGMVTDDSVRG